MPRDYDEDDDRPRARRPRRRSYRDDDDYDRPSRRPDKQVSILGIFALIKGIGALIMSVIPCVGAFAAIPGVLAVLLGTIGLVVARKSNGRQGVGLPIAGLSTGAAATLISLIWIVVWVGFASKVADEEKQFEADVQAQQAEMARQARMDQNRVRNPAPVAEPVGGGGPATRIKADDLAKAYDLDENRADNQYTNRNLEVTGVIEAVSFDDLDELVIKLKAGLDDEVVCQFPKDLAVRNRLAELRAGTTVTIRGKCKGLDGSVRLGGCVLVP